MSEICISLQSTENTLLEMVVIIHTLTSLFHAPYSSTIIIFFPQIRHFWIDSCFHITTLILAAWYPNTKKTAN